MVSASNKKKLKGTDGFKGRSRDDTVIAIVCYSVVTLFALTIIYPLLNVFSVAFASYRDYLIRPWMFFPTEVDLDAFRKVFHSSLIWNSYKNTIIITISGTLLTLVLTTLTAYPISRTYLKGRGVFTTIVIITMVFNGGIIPKFLVMKTIGLYDNLWSLIIPGALTAFNIILMINFFKSLPDSLIEAAKIDGASEPRILVQIVVPLSKPIMATIALFAAVQYWNSYFSAVMYIRRQVLWPVQLVLREIVLANNTAALDAGNNLAEMGNSQIVYTKSLQYAALIVVMVPIMCVYPFLQRYFAKGVMLGAVKG